MTTNEQTANIIKEFCKINFGGNMSAMARAMGMVPQALQQYTRSKNPLPIKASMRERLASVGLDSVYLQSRLEGGETKREIPHVALVKVPIYQSVSAGTKGNLVMEDVAEFISIPKSGDDSRFGVIVKGSSMSPRVNPGDIVIVSQSAEVMSGDLAIVLWNDGENALRTVTYSGDNVVLSSTDSAKYPPQIVSKQTIHKLLRVVMRIEKF